MKIIENVIIFESNREKEILLMLLRQVDVSELRPEIYKEGLDMIDNIIERLQI